MPEHSSSSLYDDECVCGCVCVGVGVLQFITLGPTIEITWHYIHGWSVDTDIISVLLDKHHCGSPKPPRSYFVLESQVVYRPRFSLCVSFCWVMMRRRTMMPLQTIEQQKKTSFVTNISLFNGRKYCTILLHNSQTENEISNTHKQTLHWMDISKLSLASNIHHSYVAQHRSHGCTTKFPILTLANTSLKRIKFVYTPKNKKASIPISCCF